MFFDRNFFRSQVHSLGRRDYCVNGHYRLNICCQWLSRCFSRATEDECAETTSMGCMSYTLRNGHHCLPRTIQKEPLIYSINTDWKMVHHSDEKIWKPQDGRHFFGSYKVYSTFGLEPLLRNAYGVTFFHDCKTYYSTVSCCVLKANWLSDKHHNRCFRFGYMHHTPSVLTNPFHCFV